MARGELLKSWLTPGLAIFIARHPRVLVPIVGAGWRLRRRSWWRRPPFLPVPDPEYWNFRFVTAYAHSGRTPRPDEVVDAARWSMRQRADK